MFKVLIVKIFTHVMPAHSPLEEIFFPTVQEQFPIVPLSEENETAIESKLKKNQTSGLWSGLIVMP